MRRAAGPAEGPADTRRAASAPPGGGARGEAARRAERSGARERRERGRARILRAARAVVRWLPLSAASVLGHALGLAVWACVPRLRRQTLRNLEIAYGTEKSAAERRRIGRRSFALAGRGLLAWTVFHRMGADRALGYIAGEPCREAAELLAAKGGVILLAQHSGHFELAGAWGARHIGLSGVGRDASDAGTSLLVEMRREMGVRTIEQGSARELVRALKEGGRVGLLADQDIRRVNGVFVPFFGRLAHTPVGPATMAVRLGLPIVTFVPEWRSFTRHAVRFPEVLRADPSLRGDEAVHELTARCSAAIERAVRRRPEEWLWVHDRWRTSPEDRPGTPVWRGGAAADA